MTVPYATRADVYRLGLSAQAFVVRARPVLPASNTTGVDTTTATIRLEAHGMQTGDAFTFQGTTGGALPTAISQFVKYYASVVTDDLFRVSLTNGGTPIASWASAGTGWGVSVDQGSRLDAHILDASAAVDECLTAQAPPLLVDPITHSYPHVVIGIVARMAARSAVTSLQIEQAQYRVAADVLRDGKADDDKTLADWKAGKPIQPLALDQTPGSPFNGPEVGFSQYAQPWTTPYL